MVDELKTAMPVRCATCESLQQAPLACVDCHALLDHVQGADYFELFGLPRRYDVEPDELERRYLSISRNIHPDRFAAGEAAMQSFALRASAAVNRAYEVLRNPLRRADYLLESAGGPSAAQDKRVPPDLLGQVMLLREAIEDAKADGQHDALEAIRRRVTDRKRQTEEAIARLCGELPGDDETKGKLREQLNAMKYFEKLLAQM